MDPFVTLGAAAVRVLCKLWLGDAAGELTGTVTELIASRVSDRKTRRGTENLFAALEDTVADRCKALIDVEFADVPGNERNATILTVGRTLDAARITGGDLFAVDLDARLLERHVRGAGGPDPVRDLSPGGAALYDHLLSASCAYIIELSRGLPSFESDAFATVLARQTETLALQAETLEQLRTLLDRVPVPDAQVDAGDRAGERFALAYRQAVAEHLDHLELFGVSVSEPFRRYPLTTAYLSLAVESPALRDRVAEQGDAGQHLGELRAGRYLGELRCEDVLAATSRLFLRGEAGTGKTTLLQWLAVRAARRDFPPGMSGWNTAAVPFLIKLRRYVDRELPRPEEFIDEVAANFASEMPSNWVQELLRSGRALVLIDGIDELPEKRRAKAKKWLNGLVTDFPRARYLVTSRPAAVTETWLKRDDFDAAELLPMTPDDIRRFVRRWHEAYGDRTDGARHEAALIEAVEARSHLRELAATPLLCAMLCALNADRRMHLPRDRMELYSAALEMLFSRRDEERDIAADGPAMTSREMTLLLQEFAYWLMHNGQGDADRADVVGRLAATLQTIPRLREVAPEGALRQLLVRGGVLREPVAGRVDFAHRTFQEYLAGKAAVEGGNVGALIKNAGDDQWFQTIVLAAGHAQPEQRTRLLRGLLDQASETPSARTKLHILAMACLETAVPLNPGLRDEIHAIAADLVPPRTIATATALAKIGEPVLDLLADRPPRNVREAVATIRCAREIGGNAALPAVARAGRRESRKSRTELMKAWPYFDADEYAERVLSGSVAGKDIVVSTARQQTALHRIQGLKSVSINVPDGCGDIGFVTASPSLRRLHVFLDPRLDDISALTDHPALESLLLAYVGPIDATPILDLPELATLELHIDRIRNAAVTKSLPGLHSLNLQGIPESESPVSYIPEIGNLRRFWLVGHDGPVDMDMLQSVPALQEPAFLGISRCGGLLSLNGIEAWHDTLKELLLVGNEGVSNLEPIVDLRRLERLTIADTGPIDLTPLRELHELVWVNLAGMPDGHIDLALLDAPELRSLHLYDSGDIDLRPLAGFENLRVYIFADQQVAGAELLGSGSKVIRQ